jgi:glucose-6-phosphate 1-dehydrogenase
VPFTNPLRDNLRIEATPGPTTLVIFGASGDLTRRKLLPAVYHLARNQRLPPRFAVIGVGRTQMDDEKFRGQFKDSLREFAKVEGEDEVATSLVRRIYYVSGDLDDPGLYQRLKARLEEIDGAEGVLHYLAIPPGGYETVIRQLGEGGLSSAEAPAWRRVIIEKPFGTDLASARALNALVHQHFDEDQVFRIDHYLGKETVQNLLVFRFGNGMYEPVWNRRYIDHVQITAAETVGVERRAAYYEGAGALRDMVQNHMMQLLALVAMEPPTAFTAESVRDRKMDALVSVQPLVENGASRPSRTEGGASRPLRNEGGASRRPGKKNGSAGGGLSSVVRAQYASGWVQGEQVEAYRREPDVAPDSTTETFVALKLQLDSWRWAGVPFYVRTGKRLPKRTTEIAIQFRRPPLQIFKSVSPSSVAPNLLIVNVQPDEGISVRFEAKLPNTRMQLAPVMMNFRYGTAFGGSVPEAYETLLLDAMLGDPTLFARHDFVEASWALITPLHEAWREAGTDAIPQYEAGGWGPPEADALMSREERRWRTL